MRVVELSIIDRASSAHQLHAAEMIKKNFRGRPFLAVEVRMGYYVVVPIDSP